MPRLSREDATRVIAALRRLTEVDSSSASDLEIARVVSRLSCRITQADVSPRPSRSASAISVSIAHHDDQAPNLHRTSRGRP